MKLLCIFIYYSLPLPSYSTDVFKQIARWWRGVDPVVPLPREIRDDRFMKSTVCGKSFAAVVAISAHEFVELGKVDSSHLFKDVLFRMMQLDQSAVADYFEKKFPTSGGMFGTITKPSIFLAGEEACFPLKRNMREFFSMTQETAEIVAAAVIWTGKGKEQTGTATPWRRRLSFGSGGYKENLLDTVARAIVDSLTRDQLNVVNAMASGTDFGTELSKDVVCSGGSIAGAFTSDGFHGNYFPTVFQFLKRTMSCTGDDISKPRPFIDPSDPTLKAYLERLIKQTIFRDDCAAIVVNTIITRLAETPNMESSGFVIPPPTEGQKDCSNLPPYHIQRIDLNEAVKIKSFLNSIPDESKKFFSKKLLTLLANFWEDDPDVLQAYHMYVDKMGRYILPNNAGDVYADMYTQREIVCSSNLKDIRFLPHTEYGYALSVRLFLKSFAKCEFPENPHSSSVDIEKLEETTTVEMQDLELERPSIEKPCEINVGAVLEHLLEDADADTGPEILSPRNYRNVLESPSLRSICENIKKQTVKYSLLDEVHMKRIIEIFLEKSPTTRTAIAQVLFDNIPLGFDRMLISLVDMYALRGDKVDEKTVLESLVIPHEPGKIILDKICKHEEGIEIPKDFLNQFDWTKSGQDTGHPTFLLALVIELYMNCGDNARHVEEQARKLREEAERQLDLAERLANAVFIISQAGLESVNAAIHIQVLSAYIEVIQLSLTHLETHQLQGKQFSTQLLQVYQVIQESVQSR